MIFCLVDLESVNTNCKKKIGELNVCKSEISNLSKIVEERLDQVKASKEDVTSFKGRNDLLEKDLQLAKEELDNFTSNMGGYCNIRVLRPLTPTCLFRKESSPH